MQNITSDDDIVVTIIVKALNEEQRIGACLESAQAELAGLKVKGEVILVDSLSVDRTVAIAAGLGVRIVQFESVRDRNCGAALQLGYQYARGSFIYVLDGDMTLVPGFIGHALGYLEAEPSVAGVGGKLIDRQVVNVADKMRVAHYEALTAPQSVAVLGGGGLYRREAIEQVGYLANRWLPAFEEAELGARLLAAGWRLVRLPEPGVTHSGHNESSFQLMMRLWRIGRIEASGIFLRAAVGQVWQRQVLKACWFVFAAPLLYLAALLLAGIGVLAGLEFLPALGGGVLVVWSAVLLALIVRKKDMREALISLMAWHMYPLGALRGFVRPVGDPAARIRARLLGED